MDKISRTNRSGCYGDHDGGQFKYDQIRNIDGHSGEKKPTNKFESGKVTERKCRHYSYIDPLM